MMSKTNYKQVNMFIKHLFEAGNKFESENCLSLGQVRVRHVIRTIRIIVVSLLNINFYETVPELL